MNPFEEYTNILFPNHINQLESSKPYKISEIFAAGNGHKAGLKMVGVTEDFAGIYILIENDKVIYTGISQKVIHRLLQHARGHNHFSGNLAYKFTKEIEEYTGTRAGLPNLDSGRQKIQNLFFKYLPISNEIERYLFEVYVHLHYETPYNSFQTH
jgi:hypothetical protein